MKKLVIILMIAIVSLCFVPEMVKAQDSSSTSESSASIKIHGIAELAGNNRAGMVGKIGIIAKSEDGDSKFTPMKLLFSFGMPVGVNQMTSFGLSYTVYPMQKRSVGKFFGFGVEAGYYYQCKVDASSLLKLRAPVTYIVKDIGANWCTQFWVITPLVEFSVPIGERIRIGTKINLPLALWDFYYQSKGYSHAKQWYSMDNFLNISYKFGSIGE